MTHSLERALRPSTDEAGRSWIECAESPADRRGRRKERERILSLLRFAVAGGVVELALPDGFLGPQDWALLIANSPTRFLIRAIDEDNLLSPSPAVPRLTLLAEPNAQRHIERTMTIDRPHHIIVISRSVRDPGNPNRELLDVVRHLSVADIVTRLQA
jgi:hypothetical protein